MSLLRIRQRIDSRLSGKAAATLASIEGGLDRIMLLWLLLAGLASALRIVTSPPGTPGVETIAPYLLLILAPFASMVLAMRWFADGDSQPQPEIRLARVGRWRDVGPAGATRHRLYGAGGIMVPLLVGIVLNIPVRTAEYLTVIPAISGSVPPWLSTLHLALTIDVVLLSSLYAIAFVAALRRVPLFPRLLIAIWLLDVAMQLFIAQAVASTADLPPTVAGALQPLLEGNLHKVLISVVIWLPYLLLSKRVNVTYRHRVRA